MALYKDPNSPFWWMSYSVNGKRHRESTKEKTKAAAQQVFAKRLTEGKSPVKGNIGFLLDGLLKDYKINGKSFEWCKIICNVHLRPFFGDKKITDLNKSLIADYIDSRRSKEISNSTINKELALLRRAYNLAEVDCPVKISKLQEAAPREGFISDEQYRKLVSNAPEHIRPIIVFAYKTGCRRGELFKLKWDHLDLNGGIIRLYETKNGETRTIPLDQQLRDMFRHMKRESDWIFTYRGKPIKSIKGAFTTAIKLAGLDGITLHDLRRTAIRNFSRACVPDTVAMKISGHKTRSVYDRYNIVSEADLHEAMVKREKSSTNSEREVQGLLRGSLSDLLE